MTLLQLESERTVLIDINIRKPGDDVRDVAKDLRDALKTDAKGRPYVDVMVLSHPDQDHCRGLREHFHLDPLSEYNDKATPKKIVIREMWSSPLIFRRSSKKNHTLCEDAKAWDSEARRRVNRYKEHGIGQDGDRILVLGEDKDGKTDDLDEILIKEGDTITRLCGAYESNFSGLLLAPLLADDDEEDEVLSKNESSVIMNYSIGVDRAPEAVKYLSGGDAEVAIWERQWTRHKKEPWVLEYNLLSTPHHCSWHSLSNDSWGDLERDAEVSKDARSALSQTLPGAVIVASSNEILDNEVDPPCIRAKEEYEAIAKDAKGEFWCTGEYLSPDDPELLIFEVSEGGLKRVKKQAKKAVAGAMGLGLTPVAHG
ncbi:ComEC/Rec2 family competence protein [Burkholderia cepacia]|uniref:metallohydrolase n=1 Tax=Burkholderia cepacia TaxID=292 RepID=UPI002AB7D43B|nr:metallohydrolase [Burkholderia cepacia]